MPIESTRKRAISGALPLFKRLAQTGWRCCQSNANLSSLSKCVPPFPHGLMAQVVPRSNNRSWTFRSDSWNRTYIMTTRRITSGEELK